MTSWRRFKGRAKRAARLLGAAHGSSRLKLFGYLSWDLAHHLLKVPVKQFPMDLELGPVSVTVDAFASQLGGFVDIFHLGEYEQVKGFRSRPGDVVVDAGANVGFFTLRHAPDVGPSGRVYAFEPNPAVFARLEENVRRNRLDNVTCIRAALSDEVGESVFMADARGSSIGRLARGEETGAPVPTMTLDQLVEREGLERIDLLKMDVEGHEPDVVLGGMERALAITRRIVMESHLTRDRVIEILEPLGFETVYDGFGPNVVYFARPGALYG